MATLIRDVNDLQNMQNDLAGDYELANDIDAADTATWNPTTDRGNWAASTLYYVNDYVLHSAEYRLCHIEHTSGSSFSSVNWKRWYTTGPPLYLGFRPVGISEPYNPFTGSLDGKGYKITNLYIYRAGDAGLFEDIQNATIENVHLEDADITGAFGAGPIADFINIDGEITGCSVSGSITGRHCGGIVNYMENGTIADCHVLETATLYKTGGHGGLGGIVSYLQAGTVSRCSVKGQMDGVDRTIAGIAGYNQSGHISECSVETNINAPTCSVFGIAGACEDGSLKECYFKGNIVADYACGLSQDVGNGGLIEDCYAIGSVESNTDWIGGLIAYIYNGGTVRRCYAATAMVCHAAAPAVIGGFAAYLAPTGVIENCFWDTEISGINTGIAVDDGGPSNLAGKTTVHMKKVATFKSAGWDIERSSKDLADGYPFLSWQVDNSPVWVIYGKYCHPIRPTMPNRTERIRGRRS